MVIGVTLLNAAPSAAFLNINVCDLKLDGIFQRVPFQALQEGQKAISGFIPIFSEYLHGYNHIRGQVHLLENETNLAESFDRYQLRARLKELDDNMSELVVNVTKQTLSLVHRALGEDRQIHLCVKSYYHDTELDEPFFRQLANDGSRVFGDPCPVDSNTGLKMAKNEENVEAFICNDIPSYFLNSRYKSKRLRKLSESSVIEFGKKYHSFANWRLKKKKAPLPPKLQLSWEGCWETHDAVEEVDTYCSTCVIPISLARRDISNEFSRSFFDRNGPFSRNQVFAALCADSRSLNEFDTRDLFILQMMADCLFAIVGSYAHYEQASSIRQRLLEMCGTQNDHFI